MIRSVQLKSKPCGRFHRVLHEILRSLINLSFPLRCQKRLPVIQGCPLQPVIAISQMQSVFTIINKIGKQISILLSPHRDPA